MDKKTFSMKSRRMNALAWVNSWMNGHVTDWRKVVAFANVGDFNGFEDEIKRQTDCYYPSEQSRAWFHALSLVTKEDVEEFLSLGVQSPAPDENGLEKTLSWAFFEKFAKHFVEETSFDGSQVRPVMDFDNWQKAVKVAWNTRAHAPSAGKDSELEELKRKYNLLHTQFSLNIGELHGQDLEIKALKANSAKLIEALVSVREYMIEASQTVRACKNSGPNLNDRCNETIRILDGGMQIAWDTISAYKGKEGEG